MTIQEWGSIVKVLKAAYTGPSFLPDREAVAVWYKLLQDLPRETVEENALRHISTNKFAPTIAELRASAADDDPALIAWGKVMRIMAKYGQYNPQQALAEMDERTRSVVEGLGWMQLCLSENSISDRAQFVQAYNALADREKIKAQLPGGMLRIGG